MEMGRRRSYYGTMKPQFWCKTVWCLVALFGLLMLACNPPASSIPAQEPAPAFTSSPTPTPRPAPQPAAADASRTSSGGPAAVTPTPAKDYPADRLADQSWAFLQRFTEEMSPRESATDEEKAAADYLVRELELLGYEARLQPFDYEELLGNQAVRLLDGETLRTNPLRFTGVGTADGILAEVGLARAEEVSEEKVSGRVALIRRGELTFAEKVTRVAEAGAVAAIIYNNQAGVFRGWLDDESAIPVVALSREDGERLLAMMAEGDVAVTVTVEVETYNSRNIIAERAGTSGDERTLIVGAHYDTTPGTQGANDNGTGVAVLLRVAEELAAWELPFDVRFLFFGAEEVGLLGSEHYVEGLTLEDRVSIIGMVNIDSVGSGEGLVVSGDARLTDKALTYAEAHGINAREGGGFGGSDHASFRDGGVPVLFLVGEDLSRINSPRDEIEFVEPELIGGAVAIVLAVVGQLAVQG